MSGNKLFVCLVDINIPGNIVYFSAVLDKPPLLYSTTSFHHHPHPTAPPPLTTSLISFSSKPSRNCRMRWKPSTFELLEACLSFERLLKENIDTRLKYPNQPERFVNSELELHNDFHKLKLLIGAPKLYPDLVALNVVPPIIDLLNHNNKLTMSEKGTMDPAEVRVAVHSGHC